LPFCFAEELKVPADPVARSSGAGGGGDWLEGHPEPDLDMQSGRVRIRAAALADPAPEANPADRPRELCESNAGRF